MPSIFICYRRVDSEAHAGRLYESLVNRLPDAHIFMDVDSLEAGEDFIDKLSKALASADVALVIIGRQWLIATDEEGRRRLENPKDFVHLEIASALRRHLYVIPVLVQGSSMPAEHELPEPLKDFARRQAVELRHTSWNDDVGRLVERIDYLLSLDPADIGTGGPVPSVRLPARLRRSLLGLLPFGIARRESHAFRRRQRVLYFLKWVFVFSILLAAGFAGYGSYTYVMKAPERSAQTLVDQIAYENPEERVLAALQGLRDTVVRAKSPAITALSIARLKAVVMASGVTTPKGRRIRGAAIELIKTLRNNDLTVDFRKDDLKGVDLVDVDLSRTNLKDLNLEDSFLLRTDFSGADLTGVNLSGAFVRNAHFTGATLTGSNVDALDWFDAEGLSPSQLRTVDLTTLGPCPHEKGATAHSENGFRAEIEKEYAFPWKDFGSDRTELSQIWAEYSKPGGLCETVDKWLKE
jgi:TIR domain/Pentapeptide repeats (8 copies)